MPFDPYFASKMKILERFTSVEEAMQDPSNAAELMAAFQDQETLPVPQGDVEPTTLETSEGPVDVRIYRPTAMTRRASGLVWVHGGGFAGGSIDMPEADTVSRELAFLHGITVVSVDYSLSNGDSVTYPVPHRQVTASLRWARQHAAQLGVEEDKIAVGGASAGANLAAASVFELDSAGDSVPAALILVYPLIGRSLIADAAVEEELAEALGGTRMTQQIVDHMFSTYTGGHDAPLAAPVELDLTRLPRLLTIVSEYDDLRPQGEAFDRKARAAGVDAEFYLAEGMPHGHLDRTRLVPEVRTTVERMATFLA